MLKRFNIEDCFPDQAPVSNRFKKGQSSKHEIEFKSIESKLCAYSVGIST